MTRGTINVKLRPIKLAFLVNPKDKESLLKAIEINTFLWGGTYNPIIPTYKQIPSKWKSLPYDNPSAKSVVSGYLDNFDPDYVVPMGECVDYDLDIGHRKKINDVLDILEGVEKNGVLNYGIGIFDVLNYFFEQELKFQRRFPEEIQDLSVPCFGTRYHLFFAGVFGKLPENIEPIFWDRFAVCLEAKKINCSISNYTECLNRQKLFFRRMTQFYIKTRGRSEQCIFFIDSTKPLDVMDYWNLRAIGWNVLPVPKQFAHLDKMKKFTEDIITANYTPYYSNQAIYNRTTILKSRSISEDENRCFLDSLEESKIVCKTRYPRIWHLWGRGPDHVECCEIDADTSEHYMPTDEKTISFKTLDPMFTSISYTGLSTPRFANEIDLRLYDNIELYAEVIPEAEIELVRVIDRSQFLNWRISRKGLVYLSSNSESTVELSLPQAEEVFTRWLELRGWTVDLSTPGRIAKQMIQQFGGIDGTWILAQKGIIEFLGKMSSYNDILKKLLTKLTELQKYLQQHEFHTAENEVEVFVENLKEIQPQLGGNERPMLEKTVREEIRKIANKALHRQENEKKDIRKQREESLAKNFHEKLIESNALQLGLSVQCSVCSKHSWYSMKDAEYELQCPKCTAQFYFPQSLEGTEWEYRTLGPFSTANQADGAYTVLLTLRFFSNLSLLNGATTPLMSFTIKKGGMKLLEADLALFFQASKYGDSKTDIIFVECKTFNSLNEKDVKRMIDLGKAFPGSVLVFAKLDEYLRDEEKKILYPIMYRLRRNRINGKPFNPVLILTGRELFWKSEFSEWCDKVANIDMPLDPKRYMLELCDLTQQIYLGMDPWDEWFANNYLDL